MREDKKNRARKAQQEDPGPETNNSAAIDIVSESVEHAQIDPYGDNDDVIHEYATKPIADINAELDHHGIDPRKTINAVTVLVEAKLKELATPRRRPLHGQHHHQEVTASPHRRHLHTCRRGLHRQLARKNAYLIATVGGARD